jgi:glycosyltransferase 2 family protein
MQSTTAKPRHRLQFWLGILLSLASLAAIFLFINPASIIDSVRRADFGYLLLTALTLLAFMLVRATRWRFMLNGGLGSGTPVPYARVFHVQNIGYMLSNLLPFRLGDVARAVLIGRVPPVTVARGLSTMVVERVLDLLFIVVLFPFTLVGVETLPGEIRSAVLVAGLVAVTGAVVLVVAANQRQRAMAVARWFVDRVTFLEDERWLRRLDDLLVGLTTLTRPLDGAILLALSVLVWFPIIIGYSWAMQAVHLSPSFLQAAFVVCAAAFSVTAPSSPGQIGVFEAGVTFGMVVVLGLPEAQSASFAFLYHAANYVVLGLLGVLGIVRTGATFGSVLKSSRKVTSEEPG